MKINSRHRQFVDEYMIDRNGTRSYCVAFGQTNSNSARVQACRLLADDNIKKLVQDATDELKERANISQERVLAEYAKIAFADPSLLYDDSGVLKNVKDIPRDLMAAVTSIETEDLNDEVPIRLKKVKMSSKIAALDSIRDTLGYKSAQKIQSTGDFTFNEIKTYENPKDNNTEE